MIFKLRWNVDCLPWARLYLSDPNRFFSVPMVSLRVSFDFVGVRGCIDIYILQLSCCFSVYVSQTHCRFVYGRRLKVVVIVVLMFQYSHILFYHLCNFEHNFKHARTHTDTRNGALKIQQQFMVCKLFIVVLFLIYIFFGVVSCVVLWVGGRIECEKHKRD